MIKENVRKTAFGMLGMLIILLGFLAYWQLFDQDRLVNNPYNKRLLLYEQTTKRGRLLDVNGKVLADSKEVQAKWQREYPLGEALAPVTGYLSARLGKSGAEEAFEPYLTGLLGSEKIKNDLRRLAGQQAQGLDVELTLDSGLQELGYRLLNHRRGAIVLLEPGTGKILALVSSPSFDPNLVEKNWPLLIKDTQQTPLLNRALQGLYPPGSTFKIATGAAALRNLPNLKKETFRCTGSIRVSGFRLTDLEAHGIVDFKRALAVSCNTTFATLGLDTGFSAWYETLKGLGLDRAVPFDLPTARGRVPKQGDPVLLAESAIGQGTVLETPLQMALLASAVANEGRIMQPLLMERAVTGDGRAAVTAQPKVWLSGMLPETAASLKTAMLEVVESGTGRAAALPGIKVAGKTGSAENAQGPTHSWFVGFAPAENPRAAVAVIVENAGAGGKIAAPLAGQMLAAALRK